MPRKATQLPAGPQFVQYFGPVLDALRELGGSARPAEVQDAIASTLHISEAEQAEQLESGSSRFANRVNWARFYLAKADLIDASVRGVWSLSEKGRRTSLDREASIRLFLDLHKQLSNRPGSDSTEPEEAEARPGPAPSPTSGGYRAELLSIVKRLPASGFEQLCQRLLRESGFEQVTVTGRSGDGGIDGHGVLQVNPFVSFRVLFQCKRYKETVGPATVRDFRGAMMGRADKGIILSTGTFTPAARGEAVRDGVPPIELVDGEKLVDLFESLELGLKPRKTFEIDGAFFEEFGGQQDKIVNAASLVAS